MNLPSPPLGITAILPLALLAAPAGAQDSRRDAQAYPCGQDTRLTIVQDGPSYSIRPSASTLPSSLPDAIGGPAIPIGTSLKLDSRIFAHSANLVKEVSNAPRR